MKTEELIVIDELCVHYKIEPQFFASLQETGLIEVLVVEDVSYVHPDIMNDLERMVRIHNDLNVNTEGIDVIFNLLKKINDVNTELLEMKNRLSLYEDNLD